MSEPRRLTINAERPYPVFVGSGLLDDCGRLLWEDCGLLTGEGGSCKALLVSDDTVASLYGDRVKQSLTGAGFTVHRFVFPHGEQSKSLGMLAALVNEMALNGLTRSDLVVALGGGVTGDLAGFAASVYLRGIRHVQIPTTVLAAVDSSVGGKTAVDLPAGKNLMGTFWQPAAVICDCDTFATLPENVFADGLAEAVKYGVLCDPELFENFEHFSRGRDMTDLVARCIQIKESHVAGDETDHGKRQFLNLGHTAAHAIEVCSQYAVSHGRAVAIGMAMMARAAERMGLAKGMSEGQSAVSEGGPAEQPKAAGKSLSQRLEALLKKFGLPVSTGLTAEQLAKAALSDKKRRGDSITLVMPLAVGDCVLYPIEIKDLECVFRAGIS